MPKDVIADEIVRPMFKCHNFIRFQEARATRSHRFRIQLEQPSFKITSQSPNREPTTRDILEVLCHRQPSRNAIKARTARWTCANDPLPQPGQVLQISPLQSKKRIGDPSVSSRPSHTWRWRCVSTVEHIRRHHLQFHNRNAAEGDKRNCGKFVSLADANCRVQDVMEDVVGELWLKNEGG